MSKSKGKSKVDVLPLTARQWAILAEEQDVLDKPIHEEKLFSASRITLHQYLLLHVLWNEKPRAKLDPQLFCLQPWLDKAQKMLQSYKSRKVYLDSFEGKTGEGNFFLVKKSQAEAAKVKSDEISTSVVFSPVSKHTRQRSRERREALNQTPTKSNPPSLEPLTLDDRFTVTEPFTPVGDENEDSIFSNPMSVSTGRSLGPREIFHEMYPKIEDEQIVNAALLNLLQALTEHFDPLESSWGIHRKQFKAKFNDTEYEARTDGYLQGKADGDVRALIEVKAALRATALPEIRMQESAQTVAWLKDYPKSPRMLPFRRFHVSQDRHEIWLSFAEYDDEYIKYLEDGFQDPARPRSFLTMHEFGPFSTLEKAHMEELGPILLALTLRADHDRKEEQAK